jgi:pyruvate/2-oxoglutarate dehydrogenase complex dihydrolipoamide dehydrogenase (E3) component
MKGCTVFRGHACFESPSSVRVGEELLTADKIFINAGGRATAGGISGADQVPYLTNRSILELQMLPEHLIVVGGSYVGLEFAQIFRRFGSDVTVIEKGHRLVAREDEDTSECIRSFLEAEGINVRLNAECIHLQQRDGRITAGVNCETGEPEVIGSHVLVAVGRRPNTDDLGLEKAGIEQHNGYIVVDDQLRTSVPNVWALGDCNGKGAFTHTSYNDYEIVAAILLDGDSRRVSDRILTYALYTDPPLGRAGLTETEVRKSGKPALMGKRPMTRVSRAIEKGETEGFMKVLVDAESKKILGAGILGTGGDEAIQSILDVMYTGCPYTVIQRAMHIHPTVSELIPTVFGELSPLR